MNRRVLLLTPLLIACGGFFYEPSPLLINYPERVPGKSWLDILENAKPLKPDYAHTKDLEKACRDLAAAFPSLSSVQRLEKLDALTERNREGEFSAPIANLLIEMRELSGDDSLVQQAKDYLNWRCSDEGRAWRELNQKPVRLWSDTDEQMAEKSRAYELSLEQASQDFKTRFVNISPQLAPNALIQQGAFKLANEDFSGALEDFKKVSTSFPEHPRAEVALFMTGRTLLGQARSTRGEEPYYDSFDWTPSKLRSDAVAVFQDYLKRYPTGRFVADSHGWIGAAAADEGFYGEAVKHQLDRLEVRSSREVLRSVLRDMEYLFIHLFREAQDTPDPAGLAATLPWEQIAGHPEIARLFLTHALDPTATDNAPHYFEESDDNSKVDVLHQRIVLPLPFARCALDSLGAALAKATPEDKEDSFTLQVLGWSALRDGHAERSVKLFDRALKIGKSDEILQGRARAMSALGRHSDAAASYDQLFSDFPDSSLPGQLGLQRAIAHCRAGEAGIALLELREVSENSNESRQYYDLIPRTEVTQWIDLISHFSPLEELAAPLEQLSPDSPQAYALREIVRIRALAAERFDFARRYLDPIQPITEFSAPDENYYYFVPPRPGRMDEARWNREIEPIAQAAREASRPGKASALAELKLARLWRQRDGDLLCHGVREDPQRFENAKLLGLKPDQIKDILDSQYELFHARTHYLRAIALQDPTTEATALDEVNEILPDLALLSPYRLSRAVEMDDTALSARLADRLGKIAPKSYQAARAVKWNIQPLAETESWLPGNPSYHEEASIILARIHHPDDPIDDNPYDPDNPEEGQPPETPKIDLSPAGNEALPSMEAVRAMLARLRKDYTSHRSRMSKSDIFSTGAALDDFEAAGALGHMTPELFHRYAAVRLGKEAVPAPDGEWAQLEPILAYRALADRLGRRRNDQENPDEQVIAAWQKYLQTYPNGPKTEAARLQLLRRLVYRLSSVPQPENFQLPQPSTPTFYIGLVSYAPLSFGENITLRNSILKDLHDFERDYPRSRYMADIRVLRSSLLADNGDFKAALHDLTLVLNDPDHAELHQDAALRFSEIGLRLRDPEVRGPLALAFNRDPAALKLLTNLANSDTCLFMLRPMMKWLASPALALTAASVTASAQDWPQNYALADGSRSEDGRYGLAVLDNRGLKVPAEEAALKNQTNYLIDLHTRQILVEIPGVDFSYHPDSKGKLTVEWGKDSGWALAQYIENFGMTHLVVLQPDGQKWSVKKIEDKIQELTSAAIEAKENVPLNVWVGTDSDSTTLQLYAVGDDNPKSDPNQETHAVVFSGRYSLKDGRWSIAKARAISHRDEDALLYFGRSDEKPEIWKAKMDAQLNSVYRELKAALTEESFQKLQEEQREWVAGIGKAGDAAKENLRLAVRLHELRDRLAHTLAEGE